MVGPAGLVHQLRGERQDSDGRPPLQPITQAGADGHRTRRPEPHAVRADEDDGGVSLESNDEFHIQTRLTGDRTYRGARNGVREAMTNFRGRNNVPDAIRWGVSLAIASEVLEAPDLDEPLAEMVGGRPVIPHPQQVDLGLDVDEPAPGGRRSRHLSLISCRRRPGITVIESERATAYRVPSGSNSRA